MARAHPASTDDGVSVTSSPALIHAAWTTTALVAVCLALCTIHSRNRKHSFLLRRRGSSSSRSSRAESINGAATGATPAAKVSPTPTDTPNKDNNAEPLRGGTDADGGGPVTVIDVGTHGPIAPVFLPPDPIPPRRSLSAKHIRSAAERLGRIRSMRRGSAQAAAVEDDDAFVGRLHRGGGGHTADDDDRAAVLWTKTIILGERCRVPSDDAGDATVPWKSYRPKQPRSVPVTRSNSFAGVSACKRAGGQILTYSSKCAVAVAADLICVCCDTTYSVHWLNFCLIGSGKTC
jgi:hypothetical protein